VPGLGSDVVNIEVLPIAWKLWRARCLSDTKRKTLALNQLMQQIEKSHAYKNDN
jgi:hypothetical protein